MWWTWGKCWLWQCYWMCSQELDISIKNLSHFFLYSQANFLTCSQYNNFSIIYLSIYFEEYSLKRDPQGRTYDIVDRKSCHENGNMCCQCKVSWNIQTIIFFTSLQHTWYILVPCTLYYTLYSTKCSIPLMTKENGANYESTDTTIIIKGLGGECFLTVWKSHFYFLSSPVSI